jgi:hypothetical protein
MVAQTLEQEDFKLEAKYVQGYISGGITLFDFYSYSEVKNKWPESIDVSDLTKLEYYWKNQDNLKKKEITS